MNPPLQRNGRLIERRKEVHDVGQLRHEKLVVMRVGERRIRHKNQHDQASTEIKK